MRAAALLFGVALTVPLLAGGQQPNPRGLTKDGGGDPAIQTNARPHKIELTVAAVPASAPALRFELLPPARDKMPGNAALGYLKAVAAQPAWPKDPGASRLQFDKVLKLEEARPDQVSARDLAEFLKSYRPMLRMADEAARFDRADWQQGATAPLDAVDTTLNTVQGGRELVRYLSLRAKLELAQNRPTDALRTLQTSFQVGKHYGESGTTIHLLVGLAIAHVAVGQAEWLIDHPGGPNLYWALTALPRPFLDPRIGLDGEAKVNASFIPDLKELEAGPVTEAKALLAYEDAIRLLGGAEKGGGDEPLAGVAKLGAAVGLAVQGPQAKKDLAARGWVEKDLAAMPNAQAVLLRAMAVHRELWDDQVKLFYLEYPVAAEEMARVRKRADEVRKAYSQDPLINVFALIYPAVLKVHFAHNRLERRLAQLRAVEAVRLHAATRGSLPATLDEVKVVPVPVDPMTGKPFAYSVKESTFTLTAPPPVGEPANVGNSVEYIVTVKK